MVKLEITENSWWATPPKPVIMYETETKSGLPKVVKYAKDWEEMALCGWTLASIDWETKKIKMSNFRRGRCNIFWEGYEDDK